jgi:gallate decarboxylase subunit D
MNTSGRGKYKVWLQRHDIGDDLVFFLGGGERSHIGGIVIAEPGKKVKTIHLSGHYDDIVLQPIAEAGCKKYKKKVVAVGGVHVDNATKKEIDLLVENCKKLAKKI